MKLSSEQLNILCEAAIEAAVKAGKIISSQLGKNVSVGNKAGADSLASQVVTAVDLAAQNAILEVLAPTLVKYDLGLLTEESTDDSSRFQKDHFWCIDPMDGTLAFTEQKPGFAVSIALVSKAGEALIGVVFDPSTQTLYHAIKGGGLFKNRECWKPEIANFKNTVFTLHIDRSFLSHPKYAQIEAGIRSLLPELGYSELAVQDYAGAVLSAVWTIDRSPGVYFKLPKKTPGGGSIWDFAATACILGEAGAWAASFDASPLDLNRADSSYMNHKGVLFATKSKIASLIRTSIEN